MDNRTREDERKCCETSVYALMHAPADASNSKPSSHAQISPAEWREQGQRPQDEERSRLDQRGTSGSEGKEGKRTDTSSAADGRDARDARAVDAALARARAALLKAALHVDALERALAARALAARRGRAVDRASSVTRRAERRAAVVQRTTRARALRGPDGRVDAGEGRVVAAETVGAAELRVDLTAASLLDVDVAVGRAKVAVAAGKGRRALSAPRNLAWIRCSRLTRSRRTG